MSVFKIQTMRWLKFNVVGMFGFLLQASVLFILTHGTERIGYLVATVLAVELAVLNNFVWHQYWTWRDRPALTMAETVHRLLKFNFTNGLVSIFGNLACMSVLVGRLGLAIVLANMLSVLFCSLLNFFLADSVAFTV